MQVERVGKSQVLFDIPKVEEVLVIKDQLDFVFNDNFDYPYNIWDRGIIVYVANVAVELYQAERLRQVGQIKVDKFSEDFQKKMAYRIHNLKVDDSYRKKGIGSQLLNRVIEWARIRNIPELYLCADGGSSQEEVVRFYSKHGFIHYDPNNKKNMKLTLM